MSKDPIVEEVRRARLAVESEYPDPDAHLKHILEAQQRHARHLVSRGPRRRRERKVA